MALYLQFVCNIDIHRPDTGIDSPEYEQRLTCEGERFLSNHNFLNVLSDIRDFEALNV